MVRITRLPRLTLDDADEREANLPKWAQERLDSYRRDRRRLINDATEARLATSPDTSAAVIERFDPQVTLPDIGLGDPTITFRPDPAGPYNRYDLRVRLERATRGGQRRLYVSGDDGIVVKPEAGNAVTIWVPKEG